MFIKIDEHRVINTDYIEALTREPETGVCRLLMHSFDSSNDVWDITPAAYEYLILTLEADIAHEPDAPAPDVNPKSKLAQIFRDAAMPLSAADAAATLNAELNCFDYDANTVWGLLKELTTEGVLRATGNDTYVHANKSSGLSDF